MNARKLFIYCPNCKKRITCEKKPKNLIRCSKCGLFVLIIRGESHSEVIDLLTREERLFFSFPDSPLLENYNLILVGIFNFEGSCLRLLKENSRKAGMALEKYLSNGEKKNLTPLEKNILYKLKAESVLELQKKVKYVRARIECVKLLKILDY